MLVIDGFVDPAAFIDELRHAPAAAAPVYGSSTAGTVDSAVRRTTRLTPPDAIRAQVVDQLMARKGELERHFEVKLGECEDPQFLLYRTGDYFVAHQDGNTPLLWLDQQQGRLISAVVFLNDRSEYEGGALVLNPWSDTERKEVDVRAGRLVAFRAETTHEVLPVTTGERYTIAAFFRRGAA